ncbi:sigma-54-dependent Fis family transcriptional regulator [Saccharophagus sp. K07]|uniref:sigma-54-dependent transcriptional regulator n=1 Tax=Saccharophagus sp. K07 TaxID=2283636 RepID=UPI0016523B01|nr:sigma-54-dependent Fis family transcriptional regulator [Saccharophagus sp. K07]
MPERILVVDDVVTNVQLLAQALEPAGYEILVAQNGRDALRIAERAQPGLILMDVMMPGLDGVATCRLLKQNPELADIPVIFITALDERESVVKGFTAGGVDYIVKPFHPEEVLRRVENHLNLHRLARSLEQSNRELKLRLAELERANRALAEERDKLARTEYALETADSRLNALAQREQQRWGMDGLVGKSATMQAILQNIRKLHHSAGTSVLITGESGTGKELIARAIHYSSPRAQKPFIPVNCVAIPAELAESMFFGHVKGAFTGASGGQKGFFELADGGTLFLDEIGDMPLGLQAKLLRVLEDGEVRPVGSQKAIKTDVRVVAATNVNLQEKIAAGLFRADLFYRLARFQVELPPLRQRRGDILLLAQHFLALFAREMGVRAPDINAAAQEALQNYHFPGNVRELKNLIERALILSSGKTVEPEHLQFQTLSQSPQTSSVTSLPPLPLNLKEAEQVLMRRALDAASGNITEAARLLGVHRSKLYRVMTID